MRVLLDTATFLWFIAADPKLTATAGGVIADPSNEVLLSAVSVWEIVIKHAAGRLELDAPPGTLIPQQLTANQIAVLPVTLEHTLAVAALPSHHRDPFDRLLIAQCLTEAVPVLGPDLAWDAYGVRRIWV